MANNFIPFSFKIASSEGDSLVLAWDVNNVIEKKPETRYRIYGSNDDGATYELIKECIRLREEVPRKHSTYAVSSFHPDMGESDKSSPVTISHPSSYAPTQEVMPIAVDAEGKSRALLIGASGGVVIEGDVGNVFDPTAMVEAIVLGINEGRESQDPSTATNQDTLNDSINTLDSNTQGSLSTINNTIVAKQNEVKVAISDAKVGVVAAIASVDSNINDFRADNISVLDSIKTSVDGFAADNNTDLVAVQTKLDAILTETQNINTNLLDTYRTLLRQETVLTGIGTTGVKISLPWSEKSILNQVTVIHEGGAATDFTVEILNKNLSVTERNVVFRAKLSDGFSPTRLDFVHVVSYINLDGNDLIIVRITPNNGTSNNFFVSINGEKTH